MIQTILSIFTTVIFIYSLLCLFYILMSWIPGLKFTKIGHIITAICEPYMNLFRNLSFLRIGNIDFSPIISLGILSLVSTILGGIVSTGYITFSRILINIIQAIWEIISYILLLFTILTFIRWIVLVFNKGRTSYESGWNQIDLILNKMSYNIAGTFYKKSMSYQTSLLITWITFLIIQFLGKILVGYLLLLISQIPF